MLLKTRVNISSLSIIPLAFEVMTMDNREGLFVALKCLKNATKNAFEEVTTGLAGIPGAVTL